MSEHYTPPPYDYGDFEDNPACPRCGEKYGDPWEHRIGDGEHEITECGSCGAALSIVACISVSYALAETSPKQEELRSVCRELDSRTLVARCIRSNPATESARGYYLSAEQKADDLKQEEAHIAELTEQLATLRKELNL